MKILFYLEPHPIRNSYDSFGWVAKNILAMLEQSDGSQVKILLSKHYSRLAQAFPQAYKHCLFLAEQENKELSAFAGKWNQERINTWKELMLGQGEVTDFYKNILARVRKVFDYDVIVYWSTNGAVKLFAEENAICSVAMELGCAREPLFDTVCFDPLGVNGNAFTQDIALEQLVMSDDVKNVTQHVQEALKKKYTIENFSDSKVTLSKARSVLFPLQLDDDSNVLVHSSYDSVYSMLEDMLPIFSNAGYNCYVKPHPAALLGKYNADQHKLCKQLCNQHKNVFWLENINNKLEYLALLDTIDVVVTLNSSVGFEALLFNKIVIPLGKSCYRIDDIFPSVEALIAGDFNQQAYEEHISKIAFLLLHYYLVPFNTVFTYEIFIRKIEELSQLYKIYKENPDQLTKALLECQQQSVSDFWEGSKATNSNPKRLAMLKAKLLSQAELLLVNPEAFFRKIWFVLVQKIKSFS